MNREVIGAIAQMLVSCLGFIAGLAWILGSDGWSRVGAIGATTVMALLWCHGAAVAIGLFGKAPRR
jgi:hypothetical protein